MDKPLNRPVLFSVFILLMFVGSCFALLKLATAADELLARFPEITPFAKRMLQVIPGLNLVALVGVWFWKKWGAIGAILLGVAIVAIDLRYGIQYHLFLAVPSLLVLVTFIWMYRKRFSSHPKTNVANREPG